jgi:signal transduction histidine kinase/CheY-like chemotaxis protein
MALLHQPRPLLGFIFLITLAFAGNYFRLPLFYDVDFLFGGIAIFIIIVLYGLRAGTLAVALTGLIFFPLHQAYDWVIFSIEAMGVGFLYHRKKFQLVTAVGIFWLLVGIPVIWVIYAGFMAVDSDSTLLISLNRSANSIFNAMIAGLLLSYLPLRRWLNLAAPAEPPTLYNMLFQLILALVLIPTFVLMALNGRAIVNQFEVQLHRDLQTAASDISYHLYTRLQLQLHGVATLAEIAGEFTIEPSRPLQRITTLVNKSFPDFRSMYIADARGITVAFHPTVDIRGETTIGLDFSDREYFKQLYATRLPVISDVYLGRVNAPVPIITMNVPIMHNRRFTGFVSGALQLEEITTMLCSYAASREMEIIVLDRQQQVLASTLSILPLMSRFTPERLETYLGGDLISLQEVPENSHPRRWRHAYLMHESRVAPDLPWTIMVSKPVLPVQEALADIYIRHLSLMLFLAGLAALFAWLVGKAFARSISQLGMITSDLPARIQAGTTTEPLPWPPVKSREMHTLVGNFQNMSATLQHNFQELHTRTLELSRLNKELREEHLERQRLEETVQRQKKMEAIGNLAAGVAHDLNNILTGLVGYPDLLLHELPPDSPLRDRILRIKDSGERAAAVVQDLLTLARRGVVQKNVLNFNQVVADYLNSASCGSLKALYPGIRLWTRLEPDLLNVSGSEVHFSKSLMNLVMNAAEAMPEGGEIVIFTANRSLDTQLRLFEPIPAGDYAVLGVRDNGIGIPRQDRQRIFEPFYTKKVMGRSGTGLGMSVVWTTVKDHDGFIDLQSTEGKGTTVELYLPVDRTALPALKSSVPLEQYTGTETVLVVDDIEDQREIAAQMLQKLGYTVFTAAGGEEAIRFLQTRQVDILVLDMLMEPGPDGLETYRRIIAGHPGQKAVIASGFAENARVREARHLGAGPYIAKPYTLEKLGMTVRGELDRK